MIWTTRFNGIISVMWLKILNKLIINLAIGAGVALIFFGWILNIVVETTKIQSLWAWTIVIVVLGASYVTAKQFTEAEITNRERAEKDSALWKQTLLEKNEGFKTLVEYITEYERLKDESISKYLETKSHPARRAAEEVREQSQRRRRAEAERKITLSLIEMYEQYAPFLVELKDDIPDITDLSIFQEYSEEERQDPVINYLRKDEYRRLSTTERNQLALDRFWKRPKSKWFIGKLYERYIGYLYEQMGYEVEYSGITQKYEDMGRDLICHKGDEVLIVQCKNWAQFKTIYEKHIFQLFGSTFEYRKKNPTKDIKAVFYTTTQLSDLAREIAVVLGIQLFENHKLKTNYPCIKCNIGLQTREKIYHLPFDQKYDDTKINRKGEMYCATVKEAEVAGFRRAFRWRGTPTV
ncbi:MAG: hypothetical protein UU32_C0027G0007 [Candidatus Woesebacteria bacterium GW2011_GWB1_41_10]|uniref:Restriction endonuclease type IV Mrr domain-containing protein n=1 Tax=Candidatus Woesebacteria bacterium GW2011_GWB1_41_10 TaxID=1618577 RepID=A0A0G0UET7_9BACT|nr:MAG: hypothetical protein UU32_C0027G0007 [Candidatus Woesebacteria bacterium GW2011_GWB1_41_10]